MELRELIYRHHVEYNHSPRRIHSTLFNGENDRCTLKYLIYLCNKLSSDEDFCSNYLHGGAKKCGRPLSLDYGTRSLVCEQVQLDKHHTIKTMYENYCRAFHPDEFADGIEENKLSLSTFKRTLKRGRFTRKCIQRTHVNQDPIEGVRFLEAIEHIDPFNTIDIDETKNNPESFFQKHGYALEGDVCTNKGANCYQWRCL